MYNRVSPVCAGHSAAPESWPGGGTVRRRYGAGGPAPSDSSMTESDDRQHLGPPEFRRIPWRHRLCCRPHTHLARAETANTRPRTGASVRHVVRRFHTAAADVKPPRPPSNATPEGRLAAHRARARHGRVLPGVDGGVARTVCLCSRVPQGGYLSMIVTAGRPGGLPSPPRYGVKHGFV